MCRYCWAVIIDNKKHYIQYAIFTILNSNSFLIGLELFKSAIIKYITKEHKKKTWILKLDIIIPFKYRDLNIIQKIAQNKSETLFAEKRPPFMDVYDYDCCQKCQQSWNLIEWLSKEKKCNKLFLHKTVSKTLSLFKPVIPLLWNGERFVFNRKTGKVIYLVTSPS